MSKPTPPTKPAPLTIEQRAAILQRDTFARTGERISMSDAIDRLLTPSTTPDPRTADLLRTAAQSRTAKAARGVKISEADAIDEAIARAGASVSAPVDVLMSAAPKPAIPSPNRSPVARKTAPALLDRKVDGVGTRAAAAPVLRTRMVTP